MAGLDELHQAFEKLRAGVEALREANRAWGVSVEQAVENLRAARAEFIRLEPLVDWEAEEESEHFA